MHGDWYYATDNGEAVGPITFSDLEQMARRGQLKREHLVWTANMAGWKPASSITGLWPSPPPLPLRTPTRPPPLTNVHEAGGFQHIGVRHVKHGDNWMVRHWQGGLPFWKSFWLVGILLGAGANAAFTGLGMGLERSSLVHTTRVAIIWCALVVGWSVGIWQLVGIWRSAGVYASSRSVGRVTMAVLARVFLVIGCLQSIAVTAYVVTLLTF
jgi:hypothetical protein